HTVLGRIDESARPDLRHAGGSDCSLDRQCRDVQADPPPFGGADGQGFLRRDADRNRRAGQGGRAAHPRGRTLQPLLRPSGRVDEALAWNDRALKIVRASSNPKREVSTLADRGDLLLRAGRLEAAEAAFGDALKLATKNGDDSRRAGILADLGALHMFRGAY